MKGLWSTPLNGLEAQETAISFAKEKGVADPKILRCELNLGGTWTAHVGSGGIPVVTVVLRSRENVRELSQA